MSDDQQPQFEERLLTIEEVAQKLGVSKWLLRKWDNDGKLKAVRINDHGDRRWKLSEVENFMTNLNNKS